MSSHQLPMSLTRGYSNYCYDSTKGREDPHVLTSAELDMLDEEDK